MKLRLHCSPSTKGSRSLRDLAASLTNQLGYKVWRSVTPKPNRLNLKYGQSVDKLTQYQWFQQQGLSALEFTTNIGTVVQWLEEGHTTFGRKYLNSSCGKGIVILEGENAIAQNSDAYCPVYTKYKKKKREFRVHVFKDQVVAVCEKKLRSNWNGPRDTKIRNLANGYVFCACQDEPTGIRELALAASKISPSDFKGVDLGYNEHNNDLFIIEVNSAPGIQGSNINAYVQGVLNA